MSNIQKNLLSCSSKIESVIRIVDMGTGKVTMIQPKAVESCMKPETFIVTPIEVWENEEMIEYRIGDTQVALPKAAIADKSVTVEELVFVPEAVHPELSCNPCRNCGRC